MEGSYHPSRPDNLSKAPKYSRFSTPTSYSHRQQTNGHRARDPGAYRYEDREQRRDYEAEKREDRGRREERVGYHRGAEFYRYPGPEDHRHDKSPHSRSRSRDRRNGEREEWRSRQDDRPSSPNERGGKPFEHRNSHRPDRSNGASYSHSARSSAKDQRLSSVSSGWQHYSSSPSSSKARDDYASSSSHKEQSHRKRSREEREEAISAVTWSQIQNGPPETPRRLEHSTPPSRSNLFNSSQRSHQADEKEPGSKVESKAKTSSSEKAVKADHRLKEGVKANRNSSTKSHRRPSETEPEAVAPVPRQFIPKQHQGLRYTETEYFKRLGKTNKKLQKQLINSRKLTEMKLALMKTKLIASHLQFDLMKYS